MTAEVPVRDAATVILIRDPAGNPRILMGQRGREAAFMPDKYVFPGGAADPGDAAVPLARPLSPACRTRLLSHAGDPAPEALAAAAIREIWEETGQILGTAGLWPDAPPSWAGFAAQGFRPDAGGLSFFFRALTPPGRPRRFDARFFLADAAELASDPDDFSRAEGELRHLHWVPLAEARALDLPYITRIVLAELERQLPRTGAPQAVPFVKNDAVDSQVIWL